MMAPSLLRKFTGGLCQRGPNPQLTCRRNHAHAEQSSYPQFACGHIEHAVSHDLLFLECSQMPDMLWISMMQVSKNYSFLHIVVGKIIHLPPCLIFDDPNIEGSRKSEIVLEM